MPEEKNAFQQDSADAIILQTVVVHSSLQGAGHERNRDGVGKKILYFTKLALTSALSLCVVARITRGVGDILGIKKRNSLGMKKPPPKKTPPKKTPPKKPRV